jgi:hypothetical protein
MDLIPGPLLHLRLFFAFLALSLFIKIIEGNKKQKEISLKKQSLSTKLRLILLFVRIRPHFKKCKIENS